MHVQCVTFIKVVGGRVSPRLGITVHRAIKNRLNCVVREGLSHLRALSIMDDDNISLGRKKDTLVS